VDDDDHPNCETALALLDRAANAADTLEDWRAWKDLEGSVFDELDKRMKMNPVRLINGLRPEVRARTIKKCRNCALRTRGHKHAA
jgi:hypothetical protein